jgi:hypothetical protein
VIAMIADRRRHLPRIPAQAGIQFGRLQCWMPAFAGMSGKTGPQR